MAKLKYDPWPEINAWWEKRLADGCQLSNLEHYEKGIDYRGEPPWFTHVAINALWDNSKTEFSLKQFSKYFRLIEKGNRRSFKVSLYHPNGKLFLRIRKQFVKFKEREKYL